MRHCFVFFVSFYCRCPQIGSYKKIKQNKTKNKAIERNDCVRKSRWVGGCDTTMRRMNSMRYSWTEHVVNVIILLFYGIHTRTISEKEERKEESKKKKIMGKESRLKMRFVSSTLSSKFFFEDRCWLSSTERTQTILLLWSFQYLV